MNKNLAKLAFISEFYLAGGTSLALQLGHRFSFDLDFLGDSSEAVGNEHRRLLLKSLSDDPSLTITWDEEGTFVAN